MRTIGVVRILGTKGHCTPVPEDTITSLRTLLNSGQPVFPWSKSAPGKHVSVLEGPLMGAIGVIRRNKTGKRRSLVAVELLGWLLVAGLAEETERLMDNHFSALPIQPNLLDGPQRMSLGTSVC
jgi:hypothetical protein